ncbi:MAG: ABC transporter permease [Actinobacteria bacterium]|nr:ABC transporter permease [Actinomycetota bacterium]
MTTAVEVPESPPADLRFKRRIRLISSLVELWQARELVRTLSERELRVRYKQAALGLAWAVVTPIILMVVFTVFFRRIADVETFGAPYALFSYLGVLPWTFFTSSFTTGGQSLVNNNALLNKVYCPREVFPLSGVAVAGFDLLISSAVLGFLFLIYGYGPRATSAWVPVLLLVQLAFTLGVTFITSGLLVYIRDLRQLLPMIVQLGLFATPVAYGLDEIPEGFHLLYSVLNPLVPVIDGYRRTVLYGQAPQWELLGPGAVTATLVLVFGYLALKRLETRFADVA